MSDGSSTNGALGCLSLIVLVVVLWAYCFGVTYNGHHYTMSCAPDRGVEIH